MITVINGTNKHVIKPTIFPDLTSQVWKLPDWVFDGSPNVIWNFENEREIIDLYSLNFLVPFHELSIPYLPYARQDKPINNESTFNLQVLVKLLNGLTYDFITSVDVHSSVVSETLQDFVNIEPKAFHQYVIEETRPNYLVFPDEGASKRYPHLKKYPHIVFEKKRNQTTGEIIGHKQREGWGYNLKPGNRFLIVDDLVDGGATFCSISRSLRNDENQIEVALAVTHGLFSKGKHVLGAAGIDEIFTTNSLLRNKEGFKVV